VPSIWNELRRRKVVRVAVVYAATAFAVLQAADIMLPQMNVPDWAMGLLVAFVVFGFPIALVLAWALDITPDGIRRTEAVPDETERRGTCRRCLASARCWLRPCWSCLASGWVPAGC
jgi:hypothetical protein